MIDLHCHILPGIDDGPRTFEEAVAMARLAEADGVQAIIATPHCNLDGSCPPPDLIRDLTDQLNDRLAAEGLQLRVAPGAEVRATGNLVEAYEAGELMTLADRGKFMLVELPASGHPLFAGELFFRLQLAGVTPIIAHAERFDYFRQSPEALENLARRGYPLQINVGSILGDDGARIKRQALKLINEGLAGIIASDGHNTSDRKPLISVARKPLGLDENSYLKYTLDRPFRLLKQRRTPQVQARA